MALHGPFTLVLSGGGLKGLAHIGVLRALEERGLTPGLVVGSSMGSLIAAAWAAGMPLGEMTERGLGRPPQGHLPGGPRRHGAQADALPRGLPPGTAGRADQQSSSASGPSPTSSAPWSSTPSSSTPGCRSSGGCRACGRSRVADAVFASCALPGIFPPREIEGRWYVDGAVAENMPVQVAAAQGEGPVIAVDVGATSALRSNVQEEGFAATYIRGLEIVMQTMIESRLRHWTAPAAAPGAPQGRARLDVRLRAQPGTDRRGLPRHAGHAGPAGGRVRPGGARDSPAAEGARSGWTANAAWDAARA